MIHAAYRAVVAFLVWLSAEPGVIDVERPKAAAAVHAAMASMQTDTPAPAPPAPTPDTCCGDCGGKGVLVMPDGHRVACPCPATCKCKQHGVPATSPTSEQPAVP